MSEKIKTEERIGTLVTMLGNMAVKYNNNSLSQNRFANAVAQPIHALAQIFQTMNFALIPQAEIGRVNALLKDYKKDYDRLTLLDSLDEHEHHYSVVLQIYHKGELVACSEGMSVRETLDKLKEGA
jgi:hypothetical protein